jgi:hypothetical protein
MGLTMIYRAQHYASAVERWMPRSFRVQLEWVVTAVTGFVGMPYGTVTTHMTTSVYQNNQPWQGTCTENCGGWFGTYGYST